MKDECRVAVGNALGRMVTAAESRTLERRLADAYKVEARKDPQAWQALSEGERLQGAAKVAADELIQEAQKKRVRIAQTIVAHDKMRNFVNSQLAAGLDKNGFQSVMRMLAASPDGKNNILSVEDHARGIVSTQMGELFDTWDAVHSHFADIVAGALGKESQTALEGLLIRALHGEDVGRPEIMKAATAFHDVAERLRQRFNAAGGEIGKLDNWGLPHSWSQVRASEAGKDAFVADFYPLLDRSQYVHEDGARFSDSEMQEFLSKAWQSITTNGANKPLSQVRVSGMRAGRHAESRQIHFRDGESALKALSKYSEVGALSSMANHVQRMARDIALIEQFGPNPDLAVAKLLEELHQQYRLASPGKTAESAADHAQKRVQNLYDHLAGNAEAPLQIPVVKFFGWQSKYTVGEMFQDFRSLAVGSKLGSAILPSLVDEATMHLTAHLNGISHTKLFLNELRTLNPADRTEYRLAARQGLAVHTMIDELNRWGTTNLGQRASGRVAGAVIKASGLNAITEARRRAYSRTMMDTLGALTREHVSIAALEATDQTFLKKTGITENHWAIWKLAQPEAGRGADTLLTPQSIYNIPDAEIQKLNGPTSSAKLAKDKAATALMGFVLREQDTAIITPGAREQVMMHMGTRPGTWSGELLRSFFLFKSFPIAMIERHLIRTFKSDLGKGAKFAYGASLLASTTLLGCIAVEINDLVSGRDPRSLNPANTHGLGNIMAGLLKGGALGIYGDMLFQNPADYGQSYLGTFAGPVAGFLESGASLTAGNLVQLAHGEPTHFGAELVRFAKGNTPAANLWYTKAVTDHLIFQNLQEYMSPGYVRRAKAKAQRDFGSQYWWAPGTTAPQRAPSLDQVTKP